MSPEEEVAEALAHFVRVFNDLKWDEFRSCFAPDATIFSPFPNLQYRTSGSEELERDWRPVFEYRAAHLPGPPYLNINPTDVHMHAIGDAAFLVTFHLENLLGATWLNRRTILFEKREGAMGHRTLACVTWCRCRVIVTRPCSLYNDGRRYEMRSDRPFRSVRPSLVGRFTGNHLLGAVVMA